MADTYTPRLDQLSQGYNSEILTIAKAQVASLEILAPDAVVSFQYGQEHGMMYLSKQPDQLIGAQAFVVDGKTYFIGIDTKPATP